MTSSFSFLSPPAPTHQARRRCALKKIPNRGNHDALCPACRGGGGGRQRPLREGTIAPRSLCRRTCGVIAARPQSTKGIAEPRRAAVLALAARPRYDFLTAPTSGAGAVLRRMSIASPSAAHARYIGDARTKAGLQEV